MSRRVAYTLVELSVTMTAGSSLMILAIGMLHQSMTLASTARERSDQQRTLNRLAQDFRGDVHRASECTAQSEKNIRLVMSDQSVVTYETGGDRVLRLQQFDGGDRRRETYLCGSGTTVIFASAEAPDRAVMTVARKPRASLHPTRVDRRVVAVVGRLSAHQALELSP